MVVYNVKIDFDGSARKPMFMHRLSRNQYGLKMRDVWAKYDLRMTGIEKNGEDINLRFSASKKPVGMATA